MSESSLSRLQQVVREAALDGWLIYDFRGLNPFPPQLLPLGEGILSRRWFLFVPAKGAPALIHHRIEGSAWEAVLRDASLRRLEFASHGQLDERLRETLNGARRVAMEYSPGGEIPYVSYVDGGTLERVRALGVDVVSSADLLQRFLTWDADDRAAHDRAVRGLVDAKNAAFAFMDKRLRAGEPVTELDVQRLIAERLQAADLAFDHPAIVAFGSHASDGHYSPSPRTDRPLQRGQCVILDLWAGVPDRPMADITWSGYAGEPTAEYVRVWEAVRDARDLAIELLSKRSVQQGWEVDRAARDLITARGFGEAFRHRLGHSIGRNVAHGRSVNLDDWETHDTRQLLPGLGVTVEPGVYLGHIGIRSEVNVLITESGATVTSPVQREPVPLG
ncbi:MAG: aminopeptidase P family protein [Armatimonadetes bacterium]|nr:aminopeptidase P family protein [Armatimonadota bacterium]